MQLTQALTRAVQTRHRFPATLYQDRQRSRNALQHESPHTIAGDLLIQAAKGFAHRRLGIGHLRAIREITYQSHITRLAFENRLREGHRFLYSSESAGPGDQRRKSDQMR